MAKCRPQPHHGPLKRRQEARLSGGPGSSREPTSAPAEAKADQFAGNGGAEPAIDVTLADFSLPLVLQGLLVCWFVFVCASARGARKEEWEAGKGERGGGGDGTEAERFVRYRVGQSHQLWGVGTVSFPMINVRISRHCFLFALAYFLPCLRAFSTINDGCTAVPPQAKENREQNNRYVRTNDAKTSQPARAGRCLTSNTTATACLYGTFFLLR